MSSRKIVTPTFRVSFPHIFQPNEFNGNAKYSVTMLFPGNTDLSDLKAIVQEAINEKWPGKKPANLRLPLRDGSEKDLDGYDGCIFASASSKQKPGVVDQRLQEIIEPSEIYAGCYARATITAFAYDVSGNKGVAFGLQNLQKVSDGEGFGGRGRASSDFTAIADESDIF